MKVLYTNTFTSYEKTTISDVKQETAPLVHIYYRCPNQDWWLAMTSQGHLSVQMRQEWCNQPFTHFSIFVLNWSLLRIMCTIRYFQVMILFSEIFTCLWPACCCTLPEIQTSCLSGLWSPLSLDAGQEGDKALTRKLGWQEFHHDSVPGYHPAHHHPHHLWEGGGELFWWGLPCDRRVPCYGPYSVKVAQVLLISTRQLYALCYAEVWEEPPDSAEV